MRTPNTRAILAVLCLFMAAGAFPAIAQTNRLLSPVLESKDAGAAWAELKAANTPPAGPPEWQANPPSMQEKQKYFLPYVLALADKTKDFYARFSKDTHAIQAGMQEYNLRNLAAHWGQTAQQPMANALEKSLLNDPALTEEDRFHLLAGDVDREAQAKEAEGRDAVIAQFELGARRLQKEFPNRPEVMQMLLTVAQNSPAPKAIPLLREITNSAAPAEIREAAGSALTQLGQIGQPITLQFAAVDGREVDLAKLKGKVVLLDFWATWCPPCVAEVPDVKKVYDRFHSKGFEIVGISLDKEKDKLTEFVASHQMTWPQFFDGLYWKNKYARQFKIESVPAMWLIDKKGIVRDLNARADLGGEVEKMLAE